MISQAAVPIDRASRGGELLVGAEVEQREEISEVIDLAPAGRRCPRDVVENLAVLEPVVGEPLNATALIEIDRDDSLIHHLLLQKGDGTFGALRDVVKCLATD